MIPPPEAVTAVVLVGGRSIRMGRDKATLVPDPGDGRTLTRIVLDTLSPLAAHALLAGRSLPDLDVAAVADQYPDAGPLGGIAAALAAVHTDFAVVAACDMPTIAPPLVVLLLQNAAAEPLAPVTLCRTDKGLEPLLAVWRPHAAAQLHDALRNQVRAVHDAVAQLRGAQIIEPGQWRQVDPSGASFANWNHPREVR